MVALIKASVLLLLLPLMQVSPGPVSVLPLYCCPGYYDSCSINACYYDAECSSFHSCCDCTVSYSIISPIRGNSSGQLGSW
ncbi:hypothetical protein AGIG_G25448 [Arapaima gigas]